MSTHPSDKLIRAKKLGELIRAARLASGESVEACAQAIHVSTETFEAYELGEQSPSLPEVEVLAFFLNALPEHFWGISTAAAEAKATRQLDPARIVSLRQRFIGALLRRARITAGLELAALAERSAIPLDRLSSYEFGEIPIPLPDLEALTANLNVPIQDFQDRLGPVGAWFAQQRAMRDFQGLPPELQSFVSKPINRPYLELAQRLSEMSVEKLRSVAEGLLEITL